MGIASGKQTVCELENGGYKKWIYPLKIVIFHSDVSLHHGDKGDSMGL